MGETEKSYGIAQIVFHIVAAVSNFNMLSYIAIASYIIHAATIFGYVDEYTS